MMRPGAIPTKDGCRFEVWAPERARVDIHVLEPFEVVFPLERGEMGVWRGTIPAVAPGSLYLVLLDGTVERPDPASRSQPRGVHGPSEVFDPSAFVWGDADWVPPMHASQVIYELHVGTFTPGGTLDDAIQRLDHLVELGVTTVELMPLASFPGSRNWGYDGVHLFSVQDSYGGPAALQRFVDACHGKGLAVLLDVVYNHLGPEGNYLRDFGPYFTDRYRTPWGEALNFDGPGSDAVVEFFAANATGWLRDFHLDGLRFDAVHAIFDQGARPFLQRLVQTLRSLPGSPFLVAESDLNDTRVLRDAAQGGFGFDAQWSDDFHHALHCLLTGERNGYYEDFGDLDHFVRVLERSYCHDGQYSAHRQRSHGNDASGFPTSAFVVCGQNHDQVGNRMLGERLISLAGFPRARLGLAATLLSPFVPMLFMGEEFASISPFLYFVDHGDPGLLAAISEGRRKEFAAFHGSGEVPDPADPATLERSRLDWKRLEGGDGRSMYDFCRGVIAFRRGSPAMVPGPREGFGVRQHPGQVLELRWMRTDRPVLAFLAFSDSPPPAVLSESGTWTIQVSSDPGSARRSHVHGDRLPLDPWGVVVLERHP